MSGVRPSLGLAGDGDEIDLIEEVEAAFGLAFVQEDVAGWLTLGDVLRTVERLAPAPGAAGAAWAVQRVFHRIRGAAGPERVRPSTPLPLSGEKPARLLRRIAEASGLRMPAPAPTAGGNVAASLAAGAAVALLLGWIVRAWTLFASALAVGAAAVLWLCFVDPGRFPLGVATFGDLARRAAPLNLARLRAEGADRGLGHWEVIAAIAAEQTGLRAAELGPETLLIEPSARRRGG